MKISNYLCNQLTRLAALVFFVLLQTAIQPVTGLGKVVFAVNAGGESHTDIYGIRYQKGDLYF